MSFNNKLKLLGYSNYLIKNKIEKRFFDYLRDNYKEIDDSKIKALIAYFVEGTEIPYPLYKDRKKVMNP